MEIKTAAAYIRVSTEDQTEYSPDAQLRELQEYASAHNMLLDDRFIYADEGISGRKADRRPAFLEMIRTARLPEHPFDVVLVHKFDRFARSREDSVVYKSMLKRCGVEVISIKEPIAEGSYASVMEAIYESFAEAYSINLGQEVKKGMTEKALRGEIQTAPPYGYTLSVKPLLLAGEGDRRQAVEGSRTFVPHPVEAEYVREIFRRFAAGEGLFSIAKWLTASGQRTHRGNPFENRTVEYILRNPVYIGKTRWNPKGRSRRDFDDPNIIVADGHHEPLIDLELWEQCQRRIAQVKALRKYHGRPSSERHHWLCGIVRCAACGATLIWTNPCYLKCNNYVKGRCAHSQHIKVENLEQAVLAQLRAHVQSEDAPTVRLIRTDPKASSQLRLLRQQLDRVEKKQSRLLDAYLNGADISIPKYNEMAASLNSEAADLRFQIDLLSAEERPTAAQQADLLRAAIASTLQTLESETATTEQKHDAATALIETCTFDKSSLLLTITYRLTL